MGTLVHVPPVTLDLFVEDDHGSLDSGPPSDGRFVHLTNLLRPLGTHVSGRRLYETTAPWESGPELTVEFAGIWAAASREISR